MLELIIRGGPLAHRVTRLALAWLGIGLIWWHAGFWAALGVFLVATFNKENEA
jgi:hypothetical protein